MGEFHHTQMDKGMYVMQQMNLYYISQFKRVILLFLWSNTWLITGMDSHTAPVSSLEVTASLNFTVDTV